MKRVQTIKLPHGDVRELRIYRSKRTTRLVVYDEDRGAPLIQAQLGAPEREALRKALGRDK
ncbi:MAG: hypothetical protein WBP56_20705 [Polyangia bacterium]